MSQRSQLSSISQQIASNIPSYYVPPYIPQVSRKEPPVSSNIEIGSLAGINNPYTSSFNDYTPFMQPQLPITNQFLQQAYPVSTSVLRLQPEVTKIVTQKLEQQKQPCCNSCAEGNECTSKKTETKIIHYTARQKDDTEMIKRIDELERIHIREVKEIENRLERQLQAFIKQKKEEDQEKEIHLLKSTIAELKDKLHQPAQQIQFQEKPQVILQQPEHNPLHDKLQHQILVLSDKKKSLKDQINAFQNELQSKDKQIFELTYQLNQSQLNQQFFEVQKNKEIQELQIIINDLKSNPKILEKIVEVPVQVPPPPPKIIEHHPPPAPPQIIEIVKEIPVEDINHVGSLKNEIAILKSQLDQTYHNLSEIAHLRGLLLEQDINSSEYQKQVAALVRDIRVLDNENIRLNNILQDQDHYIRSIESQRLSSGDIYQMRDPRRVSFDQQQTFQPPQ